MSARDPSIIAADPKRSAWVAANAGSGKTYTLANRVTRLLLDGAKPERILCLTYTKAAAAEMQSRLFALLGELSMLSDAKLAKRLAEICGRAPPAADWPGAWRLFAKALETPGGLKIQTLHAFCQGVLARFPLEAGVPPGFTVLDELTSNRLLEEARERSLARADKGDAFLAAAVAKLATDVAERRLEDVLRNCLGPDRRKLERLLRPLASNDEGLLRAVRDFHGAHMESESAIIDGFCAHVKSKASQLHATAKWLDRGSTKDKEKAEQIRAAMLHDTPRQSFHAFRRVFLKKDGDPFVRLVTRNHAQTDPALAQFIDELGEHFVEKDCRRRAAHAAELCHAILILSDAVRGEYAALKSARGALDYDDLIVLTNKLLEESDAAQWVLFKLDGGIDHILIDEAQDTSPEQWAIISKLTEEFFAGSGSRREATLRTVFAVGDEKQSIFSFQGADPDQFDRFRRYFEERALAAERDFVNEPLATSRRSAPEILDFVDAVFSTPEARSGLASGDAEIRHFAHRSKAQGRVELWPAIKPPEEPEPDPQREVDLPSQAGAAATLARKLADQIAEWRDRHVRLPDHPDPIRPGDIMILLPRREPFGPLVIRALKDRGIPVAGADRMRLSDEIGVRDLVALGRFAIQPVDDLTLATVLRSPLGGLSEEELLSLCHERMGNLWPELQRRSAESAFSRAHELLNDVLARADLMPPFEFFTHVLATRGMRRPLLERLGAEAEDAIEEFLSLAFAYEGGNPPSLEGFLDWIERGGAEIKRDMERGRDEVRVMTVHGAKGLEADIVILPDTTTVPQSPAQKGHLLFGTDAVYFPIGESTRLAPVAAARNAAQDAIMREHRRLLYVAMTRAKERLYICGFENKRGIANGCWYRLAEAAATRIGTPVTRGAEQIYVVGDRGDQFGLAVDPAPPRARIPAWISPVVPEREKQRLLRPSELTDEGAPPANSPCGLEASKRFQRGLLIHALLAHLPDIAKSDRGRIGMGFLRAHTKDAGEAEALFREALSVIEDPTFGVAFSQESRAEIALTAELPELAPGARVNGRVDRIAVTKDAVLIVDFKTNRPPPGREEDVAEAYLSQMALYRAAAAKIFPGRRIDCALVWTDGPKLMRLSAGLLDRQFASMRARLDPEGGLS